MICTIGPASADVDMLEKMIRAGMNIARLNFSHGTHEYHYSILAKVREAAARVPELPVGIMLDTQGPEIRTGTVKDDKISIEKEKDVFVSTDNTTIGQWSAEQGRQNISCTQQKIVTTVKAGDVMLVADGGLSLEVKQVEKDGVLCKALNNFTLGTRKNMNLPKCFVDLPILKEKDIDDLKNFGLKHQVDQIAASFVQNAKDLRIIRECLGEEGKHIKIISKIENQEGLKNQDEILNLTDGIMVARGDLGMEVDLYKVPMLTKEMIFKARNRPAGRVPIVVATQMLESMCGNTRPTRAESTDVFQAVLDGADCVMLSGESAGGQYPLESVTFMSNCCKEAEQVSKVTNGRYNLQLEYKSETEVGRLGQQLSEESQKGKLKFIISTTESPEMLTTREISRYRPQCPVVQFVTEAHADSKWSIVQFGLQQFKVSKTDVVENVKEFLAQAEKQLKYSKDKSDLVVAVNSDGKEIKEVKYLEGL